MPITTFSDAEFQAAEEIWRQYQQCHDLGPDQGRTAGIDPGSGEVWVGESILNIVEKRQQAGLDSPLVFKRIGSATYYLKGKHR